MSKRTKTVWVLVLAACIAFLCWAFYPRTFERALGGPTHMITRIEATLTPDPTGQSRQEYYSVTLTPDDKDFESLLYLLGNRRYIPLYPSGGSRFITMDYIVDIGFCLADINGPDAYRVSGIHLTGDQSIQIGRRDYRTSGSEAFQQEVLDLLLAQVN